MNKYINKINIKSFKGISNLEIENMKTINIVVGDNNSRKTSILEAVELFEKPFDFNNHFKITSRRHNINYIKYHILKEMFYNCDFNNEITVDIDINGNLNSLTIQGEEKSLDYPKDLSKTTLKYRFNDENKELTLNSNQSAFKYRDERNQFKLINIERISPIETYIEESYVYAIRNILKSGEKENLIKSLKLFDINIKDIIISMDREVYIILDEKNKVSINNLGDGIKKTLILISKIIESENGVLLIDEIETGMHRDIIKNLLTEVFLYRKKYKVQVIITTHSRYVIETILELYKESLNEVSLYRLEEFKSQIFSRRFSGEKSYEILHEEGGDLR